MIHRKIILTDFASGVSTVLLQTASLIAEGITCEIQIKVKVLFDQGSQRSYITKRVKDLLKLKGVSKESICINTFGDTKSENSILENVLMKLKKDKNETFEIKALCSNFICLPNNNQPVSDIRNKFEYLRRLKLVDSGHGGDTDILIGSDYYWGLVTEKVKVDLIGEPVRVETQFGWVLNGPVVCSNGESYRVHFAREVSQN